MALRKWTKDGLRQLTDREIKAEIMNRLGLDPKSKEDQAYYKRQLNLQYLKAQNYSTQQSLEVYVKSNENWLSTLRREQAGIELTAQQAGIKATPAQNRRQYAARIERGDQRITDQGILNLERQFYGLLTKNTLGLEKQYEDFRTMEVTTQNLVDENGEIIATYNLSEGEAPPTNLPAGAVLDNPHTERVLRTDQTIQEVKDFLEDLADQLHEYQDARLIGNRALYGRGNGSGKRKSVGS